MTAVSFFGGQLHSVFYNGAAGTVIEPENVMPFNDPPIVMVHGYNHDPRKAKHNPHVNVFRQWRNMLENPVHFDFGWYSAMMGLKGWWQARRNGYRLTYYYGYDRLAPEAANCLGVLLERIGPCQILAHSLGSRVALQALTGFSHQAMRVVLLNGAEHHGTDEKPGARQAAEASPGVEFFNICVQEDDVLNHLGEWFSPDIWQRPCIGHEPLPNPPENWKNIQLDSLTYKSWGKEHGYDLRGDNPESYGDHHFSYLHIGNHQLYRDIFRGALALADVPN